MSTPSDASAVILVGHGSPARDTPRAIIREWKRLEGERMGRGGDASARELELDRQIREWPRTAENDPYKQGLEQVASALRRALGGRRLAVAYNEMCAPSIDDTIADLAAQGVTDIQLITTMVTPGGSHSEIEIPEIIAAAQLRYPDVRLRYAWPFDLELVAGFLAASLERSG